ncbi:MAG: neutral zinc metallopeptidase [Planctomycetota bacterium]
MRLDGTEQSSNVQDRRSMKAPAAAGGGIVAIIIAVVFAYIQTGDGGQAIKAGVQAMQQQRAVAASVGESNAPVNPEEDQQAIFASKVLTTTEQIWGEHFPELWEAYPHIEGKAYQKPQLILFRDGVRSACGHATSAVGPFYCPGDSHVYLDLSFFDELKNRFGAPGDFACGYVIAHEVGHHIQNLLGLSMAVQRKQAEVSEAESNQLSVRLELQADFLAGVWAHYAATELNILEEGDVEEGIRAANAIGDDTLMKNAGAAVRPDAFTHGTSEQRIRWFLRGLKNGNLKEANVFFELQYDQL